MSESGQSLENASTTSNNIHVSEEDWLQLLQKLPPSSIGTLQQTLKRLGQGELQATLPSRTCITSTNATTTTTTTVATSNSEAVVMNTSPAPVTTTANTAPLGVSVNLPAKTTVPSMITVPPGFNLAETVAAATTQLGNTIVLPSTLLFSPSAHGQTFALDTSCLPVSNHHLMVTTNLTDFTSPGSGLVGNTTDSGTGMVNSGRLGSLSVSSETFHSLNTLANAAAAVAASTVTPNLQTQLSSGSPALTSTTRPTSTTGTYTSRATSHRVVGYSERCPLPENAHQLASPVFPGLTTPAGLTLFPVQMSSGGGSTLLLATATTGKHQYQQQVLASIGLASPGVSSSPSTVGGGGDGSAGVGSTATTTTTLKLLNSSSCRGTTTTSMSPSTFATGSLVNTSTPCTKPKFKALRDIPPADTVGLTSVMINTNTTSNNSHHGDSSSSHCLSSSPPCATTATSCSSPDISSPVTPSKRQSPPLIRCSATFNQAHKRLASEASAEVSGKRQLLLVCSKNVTGHVTPTSTTFCSSLPSETPAAVVSDPPQSAADTTAESIFSRALQSLLPEARDEGTPPPPVVIPSAGSPPAPTSTGAGGGSATVFVATVPSTSSFLAYRPDSLVGESSLAGDLLLSTAAGALTAPSSRSAGTGDQSILLGGKQLFENGARRSLKEEVEPVDDEARRRAKRRERNRVAAAKCRQRRQDQIEDLQARVQQLTRDGQDMQAKLVPLKTERDRLEQAIRQHGLAGCSTAMELISSLKDSGLTDTSATTNSGTTVKNSGNSLVAMENGLVSSRSQPPPDAGDLPCAFSSPVGGSSTGYSPSAAKSIKLETPLTTAGSGTDSVSSTVLVRAGLDVGTQLARLTALRSLGQGGVSIGGDVNTVLAAAAAGGAVKMEATAISVAPDAVGTRLSTATRPSTLIPTAALSSTSSTTVSNAEGNAEGNSSTNTSLITPCFLPAELQGFSPILTPSTWKLLRNLTLPQANSASTPQTTSILLTPELAAAAVQVVAASVSGGGVTTASAVVPASVASLTSSIEVDDVAAAERNPTVGLSSGVPSGETAGGPSRVPDLAAIVATTGSSSTNNSTASGSSDGGGGPFATHAALHSC